ncbi:uncharacterized protein LOC135847205 [Planococcus citri]|uniref:uncharacterized protein LOC135847205 n=1 Tax=Planococcus citri TaxID=170843 RepID=UPI0031F8D916
MLTRLLIILPLIFHQITCMEITLPFSILSRNPTFVDKTLFLSELFNCDDTSIILTSPRGFGKTTTISMIELFSSIDLKDDDINSTQFKVLGHVDPSAIFQKTLIARDTEFIRRHQSQYVVLKLDMEVDFPDHQITSESIRDKLLDVLLEGVKKYSTILRNHNTQYCQDPSKDSNSSTNLIPAEAEVQFLNEFFSRNISVSDISLALREIIQILSRCLGRKVILLVDNYDHVAAGFLSKNTNLELEKFYHELNTMLHYVSDLFSTSTCMFKALIMSISAAPLRWGVKPKFEFETIFKHYEFLGSHRFVDFIGLNETEVEQLVTKFHLEADEKLILSTYYDAYRTYPDSDVYHKYPDSKKIYNPRHLTRFIKLYRKQVIGNEVLSNVYKESFKYIGFIGEHLNNRSKLELELLAVISNQSLSLNYRYTPPFYLPIVKEIMNYRFSSELAITKMTWSYLFDLGFLTPFIGNLSTRKPYIYKIANQEAQRVLYKLLIEYHNESRLPFNEVGKCSQQFVVKDVILNKQSIASLFGLVEMLLGRCINNTAQYGRSKDNELRYQSILYASSSQFANSEFFVSTMQFRNRANDTFYGVYYYNTNEKVCSIVITRNCDEPGKVEDVLLNEAATSYSLPHAEVKHIMYAVVNVFKDGHLETFYVTYERC